ncbi:MAG: hypothetical protein ABJN26_07955 [Stappiaceae bacterium]
MKRLDRKLEAILAGRGSPENFIIADAKDGDMGFGLLAPGPSRIPGHEGQFGTLKDYLKQTRSIIDQDKIDICLLSASNLERLVAEGAFADTDVTMAVRTNDSTDIWNNRNAGYLQQPSRPHRAADLARARALGCELGLYSMTFMGNVEDDLRTLEAFKDFRDDALANDMPYFLEVFNPNTGNTRSIRETGAFVNDCIARSVAPLMSAERPRFLKIAYGGRESLRELVNYDDQIVVGILGGSSGTTCDTLTLLKSSADCGAWVALFGRKINLSESPLDTVRLMRAVVDGELPPVEGVHEYHKALAEKGISPNRSLEDDLKLTDPVLLEEA